MKKQTNIITHKEKSEEIRLNKYISETGFCSRREADNLIENKRVKIDGVVAETGMKVSKSNVVTIDNKIIKNNRYFI